MGTRAFAVLVAVVFGGVLGACKSDLLPGRCDSNNDCASDETCNLEKNGRCEKKDGGASDADASGLDATDAGDAHDAFSCEAAMCGAEIPVCDVSMMKCRACGKNDECIAIGTSAPVCASSGKCVECVGSTDCSAASAPICKAETNTCTACTADDQCKLRAAATPGCASGKCVECTGHAHCGTAKPICDVATNTCGPCKTTDNKCAARDATKPACTATGTCVECVANTDCKDAAKPICDTTSNTCKPCKADAECTDGPKVCMSHLNGRCATDAETIYVRATGTCASTVGANSGTATVPYCSMDPAVGAIGTIPTKDLVVIRGPVNNGPAFAIAGRQVSIVGQMTAALTGGPIALRLSSGDLYVRSVTVSAGMFSTGVQADAGSILRLDRVVVTGNKGGVYLNGAAFDIQNTSVTNNELVDDGAIWAGIYAKNPPAAGPAKLKLVTVQNNKATGIVCSGPIEGDGVLSLGNMSSNINTTCKVTNCDTASATCGAQP